MPATIIDGKILAQSLKISLIKRLNDLKSRNVVPCLAVILVGDDPSSILYVTNKKKACAELGLYSHDVHLPSTISEQQLLDEISNLNANPTIHGILVQLPLPLTISAPNVIEKLDPMKDVDGFHPLSLGKLFWGQETFIPCTPHGIIKLLEHTKLPLTGLDVVIVGCSNIVGRPLAFLLSQPPYCCTVTLCHSQTHNLAEKTRQGDVIVVAVGKSNLLNAEMIKPGACVIDVGINRIKNPDGCQVIGDIDLNSISQKASFVTPVPGGVGPMTIMMLMHNTIKAACLQHKIPFEL